MKERVWVIRFSAVRNVLRNGEMITGVITAPNKEGAWSKFQRRWKDEKLGRIVVRYNDWEEAEGVAN